MPSQSSAEYLERRKIFLRPIPGGRFATDSLQSHRRAVAPLPQLLPADTPAGRVLTQKQEERIPYVGDCHANPKCDC